MTFSEPFPRKSSKKNSPREYKDTNPNKILKKQKYQVCKMRSMRSKESIILR